MRRFLVLFLLAAGVSPVYGQSLYLKDGENSVVRFP